MKPGRKLDNLIATEVMGWKYLAGLNVWASTEDPFVASLNWGPSTDIAAAWDVIDKLSHYDWDLFKSPTQWTAVLYGSYDDDDDIFRADGKTAALAICLAALKAVGHEV